MNKIEIEPLKISHREEFGAVLNSLSLVNVGAEIGCAWGGYAEKLLALWKGKKLFMVDPWNVQPSDVYKEKHNTDPGAQDHFETDYRQCLALANRDPRVSLVRAMSINAASNITDNSLDFVYIDANHSYNTVLEDMDAWYPKVRSSGVFSGHDFYEDTNYPHFCQVKPAVERWMSEHNISFHTTDCSSWWSRKY